MFRTILTLFENVESLELDDREPWRQGESTFTHVARALIAPERVQTLGLSRPLPGSTDDIRQILMLLTGLTTLKFDDSAWTTELLDRWPGHCPIRVLTFCRDAYLSRSDLHDLAHHGPNLDQLTKIEFEQHWIHETEDLGAFISGYGGLEPHDFALAVAAVRKKHPGLLLAGPLLEEVSRQQTGDF